jgi:hypothetical protein
MALSYKKDVREVDKEFQQLIDAGWTPVENPDGKTYSWVKGNEVYRGKDNPTPGIDADAGALDWFRRGRRQRRLMSEKVTAMLPLTREAKKADDSGKNNNNNNNNNQQGGGPGDGLPDGEGGGAGGFTFVMPDTRGLVPAGTIDPDKYQLLPFEGTTPEVQLPEVPLEEDEVPTFNPDRIDMESPYVYATPEQIRSLSVFGGGKFGGRTGAELLKGRTSKEIQAEKMFGTRPPFDIGIGIAGGDNTNYPRKIVDVDGKERILIRNPHYKHGAFDTQEEALGYSMIPGPGVLPTNMGVQQRNVEPVKTADGRTYYRIQYPLNEKVGQVLAPGAVMLAETFAGGKIAGWAGKKAKGMWRGANRLISKVKGTKPATQAAGKAAEKVVEKVAPTAATEAAPVATNVVKASTKAIPTSPSGMVQTQGLTITPKGTPTQILGYPQTPVVNTVQAPSVVNPAWQSPVKPKLGPRGKGFGPSKGGEFGPKIGDTGPGGKGFKPGEASKEASKKAADAAKKKAQEAASKRAVDEAAKTTKPKTKLKAKNSSTKKKGGK